MQHLIVDTSQKGLWFTLIYLGLFILVNGVFIQQGLKKGHPFVSLWLIAITGTLFFIAGTGLFTFSFSEWKLFLFNGVSAQTGEKSVLGGILALFGFLLAIYWLKEKVALIDHIAIAFIVAVGIQNIGCLKAGCCYGITSSVPWAIRYDSLSRAFGNQLADNLIGLSNEATLPLHPVQLYLLIGSLLIGVLLWKARMQLKAPLSLMLTGWILYSVLRFGIEFLRDPATNHGAGYLVYGIKAIQWYLLATAILLGAIVTFRERKFRTAANNAPLQKPGLWREVTLLLFIFLLARIFNGMFGFADKLLVNSALFISFLVVGWKAFRSFTLPRYRIATMASIAGSLVLMGQDYIPKDENEKVTFTEISWGVQTGQYYNMIAKNFGLGTDCDGNPAYMKQYSWARYNSYTGGLAIAKTANLSKYKRTTTGLNAYFGYNREDCIDTIYRKSLPVVGIHPYFSAGGRWVGFSAGIHLGNFHFADEIDEEEADATNVGEILDEPRNLFFYPSLSLRIGPMDMLYIEPFLAEYFPSASPLMQGGVRIGTGLGKTDGRNIELGYSTAGYMINSMFPIKKNCFLSGSVNILPRGQFDKYNSRYNVSLGLHHRFNYKTKPRFPEL